jgi:iron complex outermembrane receptor protein
MKTRRFTRAPLAAGLVFSAITQAVIAQTAAPTPSAAPEAPAAPAAAVPAAAPAPAAASQASSGTKLEAVTITANKREERLQEVPATASVVQPQQLEQQRILTIEDLGRAIPTVSGSGNGLQIRGFGATSFSPTAEGAVGILVDGVSLAGSSETPPNLFDVERVEVLEGPQGTLFGKNSSAGIVNIVTVAPKLDKFSADARIEGRTHSSGALQGALNVPVNDTLGFRFSGSTIQQPKLIHNLPDDSWDGARLDNLRARMRWLPSADLRVDLSADTSVNKIRGGAAFAFFQTTPGSPLTAALARCGVVPSAENTDACVNPSYHRTDKSDGVSGQVDWFLGDYTLTSVTAFRKASTDTTASDLDGINLPAPNIQQAPLFKTFRNTSQEFRVASPDYAAGNFVLGAYYYHQDIEGGSTRRIDLNPIMFLGDTKAQEGDTTSLALFGQGTYRLTKALSFTGGARVGHEKASTTSTGGLLPGAIAPVIAANLNPVTGEITDTYTSYRASTQYEFTPNHMAYVLYSKGYKGPTINDVVQDANTPIIVRPEIPTMWEVGLKNLFMDGRVGLNLTAYDTKVKDYQTTVLDPKTLSFVFGNAPSADLTGVSASFYGRLTPALMINGGVWRGKVEIHDRSSLGAAGATPTTRATLAADYSFLVAGLRSSVGADLTYVNQQANDPSAPLSFDQKATIVGAKASVRAPSDKWGLTLSVRNLFDKFDPAGRSSNFLGTFTGDTGSAFQSVKAETRRIVGLALDAKF